MILLPTPSNISKAIHTLAHGDLIGLPTETVYGLAADAHQINAIAKIYSTKGRPSNHPLIVHVSPDTDINVWVKSIPDYASALIKAYWPGALTLVLPKTKLAHHCITGGQSTVAIRCPSHPVAQQLLREALDFGIQGVVAPSANRFGRVSPSTALHVEDAFNGVLTLDGGACEIGIESTIVDCTQDYPRLLRYGMITAIDIARVTGFSVGLIDSVLKRQSHNDYANLPRVSGDLNAHYAPNTPVYFYNNMNNNININIKKIILSMNDNKHNCIKHINHTTDYTYHRMPNDPVLYARQLYATLRTLDTMGYDAIIIDTIPDTPQWAGVLDRLSRAAATFTPY